ncbi:MAG: cell division protein ZapE [Pseudomonadota bacterium]
MTVSETYAALVAQGALVKDPAQVAALVELDRIATALAQPQKRGWFAKAQNPPKGLYLWGGVGRGKSMVMDLFADCVPGTRRIHFHAFMQNAHLELAAARKRGVDDAVVPVADHLADGIRCLAFDEMQITDITDAMIVGRLFQQLMARGVVIVATSNRHPDDLYKDGLNRALFVPFIDLIKSELVVHQVVAEKDYRQDRLAGSQSYFTPLGADADQALDAVWNALAGGASAPLDLTVNGRVVVVPQYRNGVGQATFQDLCAEPLGPADYLALAQALKVLILRDVPILGPANNNEAKRFVTLIDTLYEARLRLVMSAASDPESLYPTGRGSFEFERTASRLREMQSADWAD